MIIQCEECGTKFGLDDSMLKEQGSKVRCSRCKHVFMVYPPKAVPTEKPETEVQPPAEQLEFDQLFEEPVDDVEQFEAGVPQDFQDLLEKESGIPEEEAVYSEEDFVPELEVEEPVADDDIAPAPVKKRSAASRFFAVILLIILILIAAGVGVYFFAPQMIPDSLSFLKPRQKGPSPDRGVRRLSFNAVSGSFVPSEKEGNLFVIQGLVKNEYPTSRSFILLKGTILDDKGAPVKQKKVYAGNTLKEEEIRAWSMKKINQAMKNRQGMNKSNVNVPPGATIPFTMVFEKLPENLSEFTVEAVSSSPGEGS